ncbi:Uncharacterized protein SCF082_LOCUS42995 [Durusdinium trenchii]|uniref:Uncharacterized protein n=1 Tax=Durusdinium trenchii TaxID=1381693 RepID=A0ABP0QSL3_9DINO
MVQWKTVRSLFAIRVVHDCILFERIYAIIKLYIYLIYTCILYLFNSTGQRVPFTARGCGDEEVQYIRIPVKFKDANGKIVVHVDSWPIIDVHSIMAFAFEEAGIEIPTSCIHEYWRRSCEYGEPFAQDTSNHHRVPIGLYGDSAKVRTTFGSENVIALFANLVLWRPKSVRWSRFLLCCIPEERCTSQTLPTILKRIVWSANHAWHGRWPGQDLHGRNLGGKAARLAGKPLTSQFHTFQVVELRGDWAWHKKVMKFWRCNWNSLEDTCPFCPAKIQSDDWNDLYWNPDSTLEDFTLAGFLAKRMPPRGISPLVGLKGFHPSIIRWCLMHALHLGLLYTANGGTMNLLVKCCYWAPADEPTRVHLHRAYIDFKTWCVRKRINCSQPAFKENLLYLKTGDIRLLCKAYNGRCVAQWLAETVAAAAQDAQFQAADATNTIAVVAVTMIFGGKC